MIVLMLITHVLPSFYHSQATTRSRKTTEACFLVIFCGARPRLPSPSARAFCLNMSHFDFIVAISPLSFSSRRSPPRDFGVRRGAAKISGVVRRRCPLPCSVHFLLFHFSFLCAPLARMNRQVHTHTLYFRLSPESLPPPVSLSFHFFNNSVMSVDPSAITGELIVGHELSRGAEGVVHTAVMSGGTTVCVKVNIRVYDPRSVWLPALQARERCPQSFSHSLGQRAFACQPFTVVFRFSNS